MIAIDNIGELFLPAAGGSAAPNDCDIRSLHGAWVVIDGARGSDLDPSTAGDDGYSSKWGVDATAKPLLADFTPRHHFPQAVWDAIDLDSILR